MVAGIHTHACVRETVLGLHELGLTVRVAREAVGSREPHHAAQTEIYLRRRGIAFGGLDEIVSQPDGKLNRGVLSALAPTNEQWERAAMLGSAAYLLERNAEPLAAQVTRDIGKPLHFSRGEVARAAALFRAVARRISAPAEDEREAEATVRRRPHGIVAMLTPWNNPLAIAAGQFAPAFGFGNAVVWKPAPAGLSIGMEFRRLLLEAGLPPAALQVVSGGEQAGLDLMSRPGIDAV